MKRNWMLWIAAIFLMGTISVFADDDTNRNYVSTLGMSIELSSLENLPTEFTLIEIRNFKEGEKLVGLLSQNAVDNFANQKIMGVLLNSFENRDFKNDRQYVLITPPQKSGMPKLEQPYYLPGSKELIFDFKKEKEDGSYLYLRSYAVSKKEDTFDKVVLADKKYKLEPQGLNASKDSAADDSVGGISAKTDKGLLYAGNFFHAPFTLEIKGKSLRRGDNGGEPGILLQVDDRLLQVEVVEINKFAGEKDDLSDTAALLKKHMKWELDYQQKGYGVPLKSNFTLSKLPNGQPMSLWSYELPESFHHNDPEKIKYGLLAATRNKSEFVVLFTPVTEVKDLKQSWNLLTETMLTLKERDQPITPDQLHKEALGK